MLALQADLRMGTGRTTSVTVLLTLLHRTLSSAPCDSVCELLKTKETQELSALLHNERSGGEHLLQAHHRRTPLTYGNDKKVPITGICLRKLTTTGKKSLSKWGRASGCQPNLGWVCCQQQRDLKKSARRTQTSSRIQRLQAACPRRGTLERPGRCRRGNRRSLSTYSASRRSRMSARWHREQIKEWVPTRRPALD